MVAKSLLLSTSVQLAADPITDGFAPIPQLSSLTPKDQLVALFLHPQASEMLVSRRGDLEGMDDQFMDDTVKSLNT